MKIKWGAHMWMAVLEVKRKKDGWVGRVCVKLVDESPSVIPRTSPGNWWGIMGQGGRSKHYRPPFVSSLESSVGAADSVVKVDYIIFKKTKFILKTRWSDMCCSQGKIPYLVPVAKVVWPFFPADLTVKTTGKSIYVVTMETEAPCGHCCAICMGMSIQPPDTATQIAVISC